MTTYIRLPDYGSPYWQDPVATSASLPTTDRNGTVRLALDTGTIYEWNGSSWNSVGSASEVIGPGSSSDGGIVIFDGTTGKLIKQATGSGFVKATSGVYGTSAAVSLTADVSGTLPVANGGTNSTTALNNNRVMKSSGGAVVEASAITASRALVSDSNGIPVAAAATTTTEIGYVNGVTSAIQTQIDSKQATITGAATTITSSNLATSVALVSDGSGKVAASAVTATELGYVGGVTSAIQTQIATKAAGAASSTDTALAVFSGTGGKTLINSAVTLDANGGMTFTGTTGFCRLPNLTTTQMNALTPAKGMLIYCTSTDLIMGYVGSAWVSLIGWGA